MAVELDKQYQTRDGRRVVLLDDNGGGSCRIRGAHVDADGDWDFETWRAADGKFDPGHSEESDLDLISIPQPDPAQKRRELAERLTRAISPYTEREDYLLIAAAIERVLAQQEKP